MPRGIKKKRGPGRPKGSKNAVTKRGRKPRMAQLDSTDPRVVTAMMDRVEKIKEHLAGVPKINQMRILTAAAVLLGHFDGE